MNYTNLTTEEVLRVAYAEQDELTSTPLELELRRRLQDVSDELEASRPLLDVLGDFDELKPDDLRALLERMPEGGITDATELLSVLAEEEIPTADALRARLKQANKLADLTEDPDAALEALETLFNTAS